MSNELPIYPYWDKKPDRLKTKKQLDREGFKPGGPARGLVRYKAWGKIRRYKLYDQAEAIEKQPPTEAQLAALAAANLTPRVWRRCGTEVSRPCLLDEERREGPSDPNSYPPLALPQRQHLLRKDSGH